MRAYLFLPRGCDTGLCAAPPCVCCCARRGWPSRWPPLTSCGLAASRSSASTSACAWPRRSSALRSACAVRRRCLGVASCSSFCRQPCPSVQEPLAGCGWERTPLPPGPQQPCPGSPAHHRSKSQCDVGAGPRASARRRLPYRISSFPHGLVCVGACSLCLSQRTPATTPRGGRRRTAWSARLSTPPTSPRHSWWRPPTTSTLTTRRASTISAHRREVRLTGGPQHATLWMARSPAPGSPAHSKHRAAAFAPA